MCPFLFHYNSEERTRATEKCGCKNRILEHLQSKRLMIPAQGMPNRKNWLWVFRTLPRHWKGKKTAVCERLFFLSVRKHGSYSLSDVYISQVFFCVSVQKNLLWPELKIAIVRFRYFPAIIQDWSLTPGLLHFPARDSRLSQSEFGKRMKEVHKAHSSQIFGELGFPPPMGKKLLPAGGIGSNHLPKHRRRVKAPRKHSIVWWVCSDPRNRTILYVFWGQTAGRRSSEALTPESHDKPLRQRPMRLSSRDETTRI